VRKTRHTDCAIKRTVAEEVFDMKLRHTLAITAVAAACSLGLIDARGAKTESPNPPRTQQEIMKERYAACRDLHGPALEECMASYVGTPDKNLEQDVQGDTSKPPRSRPLNDAAQGGTPNK
jgi:hypothetical protein